MWRFLQELVVKIAQIAREKQHFQAFMGQKASSKLPLKINNELLSL